MPIFELSEEVAMPGTRCGEDLGLVMDPNNHPFLHPGEVKAFKSAGDFRGTHQGSRSVQRRGLESVL